jgi:putative tricarboxylic transport membrane protein
MLTLFNRFGLTGPLITACVGFITLVFLHTGGETKLIVDDDALGPVSWPRVMILGVIGSSLLWGISRFYQAKKAQFNSDSLTSNNNINYHNIRLAIGIFTVAMYGAAMVYIGFAFSTFLFLISWFLLGGLRNPFSILANSLLGTLAMLYLFLKVAYLPLPRGVGFMDEITVGLYRFLGIF